MHFKLNFNVICQTGEDILGFYVKGAWQSFWSSKPCHLNKSHEGVMQYIDIELSFPKPMGAPNKMKF